MREAESAKSRYNRLQSLRSPYLDRGRECSRLTIPALLPDDGHTGSSTLYTPFQSLGSDGVRTLSAKLLLALLPPNNPFFRLRIPAPQRRLMEAQGNEGKQLEEEFNKVLSEVERTAMEELESTNIRSAMFTFLQQLIVAGNAVLQQSDSDLDVRVYRLDQYVARRNPKGALLELILKEKISRDIIPKEIADQLPPLVAHSAEAKEIEYELYTHVIREGKKFRIYQEVEQHKVPGSEGSIPEDRLPYIVGRWRRIDGEHYGRGHVEEYLGDLSSLEGVSQSIVEAAAAMAYMLTLVKPAGDTDLHDIQNAPNLAVRAGNPDDVGVVRADKGGDLNVPFKLVETLTGRLNRAFLLTSAIQRQAERVTAEEIRLLANELEDALGGVYSILAQEVLAPLIRVLLFALKKSKAIPAIPNDVKPTITAGLDALGRSHDLQKIGTWASAMQSLIGPEQTAQLMKPRQTGDLVAASLNLDISSFTKTPEEIQEENEAASRASMVESLGAPAINARAKVQAEQVKAQA